MRVGIIGLGRLGEPLARGLVRSGHEVLAYNRSVDKAKQVAAGAPGLALAASAAEVFEACDPVFVWMDADQATTLLGGHHDLIAARRPLLVSCTTGVPLAEHTDRWAETIPNVCLSTGHGVTLLTTPPHLPAVDRERLVALLGACGDVHELSADDVALYTVLASCGPALYARMLQQYADALAQRHGLDAEVCRSMVLRTAAGTLALMEQDDIDADEVVRRVAHPGGLTGKGLRVLEAQFPAVATDMLKAMGR